MIKTKLAIFVIILVSLLFMLSLSGCASETPVAEPETPAVETETPEAEPEAPAADEAGPDAEPEDPAADDEAPEEEPEPLELSFEASEYVNSEYGFSVHYPAEWGLNPITEPSTIVLYAVAEDAVPLVFVNVVEAAAFEEALEGAVEMAEGSGVNIKSQEESKLIDGTDAVEAVFKFKHPAAPLALDAVAVAAEKDGKWVTVTVATLGMLASFDEELFFEIAYTLQFD